MGEYIDLTEGGSVIIKTPVGEYTLIVDCEHSLERMKVILNGAKNRDAHDGALLVLPNTSNSVILLPKRVGQSRWAIHSRL